MTPPELPSAAVIAIGSMRPAKVEAARSAIEAIARVDDRFRLAVFRSMDLTDIAPSMPMTDQTILEGARLRARTLLDRVTTEVSPREVFAIGLEGGLDPFVGDATRYMLKTWAAVTDGRRWGFGSGGTILVPTAMMRAVLAGRELGDVVDGVAGPGVRGTRGAWGVLTRDLIDRQASFRSAILAAFAPFYNSRLYEG